MGVTMLASVRPHSWDFALFIHVGGAMILFGGLVTAAGAGILGWREATGGLRRFSALTLFAVALPGWLIMRAGALVNGDYISLGVLIAVENDQVLVKDGRTAEAVR